MIQSILEALSVIAAGVTDVVLLVAWRVVEAALEALVMWCVSLVGVP